MNTKKEKNVPSKSSVLKSVMEVIKFHLVGTGGKYALDRGIPLIPSRPGSITPEHLEKIRRERLENQRKWEER